MASAADPLSVPCPRRRRLAGPESCAPYPTRFGPPSLSAAAGGASATPSSISTMGLPTSTVVPSATSSAVTVPA